MKPNSKILLILVIILAVILGIFYLNSMRISSLNKQPQTTSFQQTKNFHSKNLKFSVDIPSNLEVEERFTNVIFKQGNIELKIARNGTNFERLEDFLNDLARKNKMTISNKENLDINGLTAIKGNVQFPGGPATGELTYYIKADFAIYIISTSNQPLFSDLDQIAQSFRYTP